MDVLMVGLVYSVAVVLITTLLYFYYRWWSKHPLYGQNKGEKVYPLLGSIVPILKNVHRLLEYSFDLVSKMPGHTFREVRPGGAVTIVTANPTNVEHILKTNFENYPKGKLFHDNFHELLGNGIFNIDDRLWKIQRKQTSHMFTARSLRDLVVENVTRQTSNFLMPLLCQASESGHILDLQSIFAKFAFDDICQLAFGEDLADLDGSMRREKFSEAFDKASLLSMKRLVTFPQCLWTIQRALDIGNPKELRIAMGVVDEFAMRVVKTRKKEFAAARFRGDLETVNGKADLLSRFVALIENDEKGQSEIRAALTEHERKSMERKSMRNESVMDVFLRDMVISIILAGRDTTLAALSWFFWVLSTHPHAHSRILEEISRIVSLRKEEDRGEQISQGENWSTFSFEELKSMHYLHAALTESLRLYPPVPANMKCARSADVWPDGTVIQANAIVMWQPYSMGRLEDLWGKDALQFKPERWLKDGMFVSQSPYKYTVFQGGPRICLGKDMVMLQMKLMCASILSKFDICVSPDFEPNHVVALTMQFRDGLPVTVQKRKTLV